MCIQDIEFMAHECRTRDEFIIEIIKDMNKQYSEKYMFESRIVDALNGTKVNSIVALDAGKNEIFQLPIQAAYEYSAFMGKEEVYEKINHNIEQFEEFYGSEDITDAEKQIIQPWIINKEMNQELLHRCPYTEYGDYVIVYRTCPTFDDYQLNYGLLTWEIADRLSLNLEQLHELAIRNVEDSSLYRILCYNGCYFEEVDDFSYHIGNAYEVYMVRGVKENYSTGSLFCKEIWRTMGKMMGCNYYIVPSCVHEWVVMSTNYVSKEEMESLIVDVNAQLKQEHLLGEQYYLYDIGKDEILPIQILKDE